MGEPGGIGPLLKKYVVENLKEVLKYALVLLNQILPTCIYIDIFYN